MATKAQMNGARKLVDLDVREVSVVDRPANLRPFLVTKRAEDSDMGFTQDYGIDPAQVGISKVDDSSKGTGSGDNGNSGDTTNVIDVAKNIMAEVAKAEGMDATGALELLEKAKAGPITALANTIGFDAEGNVETVTKAAKPPFVKMAGEAGYDEKGFPAPHTMKGKPPFADMAGKPGYDKKGMPMPFKEMANKAGYNADGMPSAGVGHAQEKTQKNADGNADGEGNKDGGSQAPVSKAVVQVMDDGSVIVAGQPVAKNSAQVENLANVIGALTKDMGDEDRAALESALAKGGQPLKLGDLPKDAKVDSQVRPSGTGPGLGMKVTKSEDGTEYYAKADVDEAIRKQDERITAIEKARAPSQSVEGDGGTEVKTEKNASMWSGVL
jgi:hypothetical protein